MRPTNSLYVGGPALDPPEDEVMLFCRYCKKVNPRSDWVRNHEYCPACHEEDAAGPAEEE